MKKVIIIGAGIAGLTCGVYARLNGFDTEIYELHTIPGGECTGWDRGGYHFDGCIHWLVGTKPESSLHKVWRTTGALDDSVKIVNHDIYIRYEEGGKAVNFYTNIDKLEKHLLEIAPEDKKEIKKLCAALRSTGGFGMPIDKPMDMMTAGDGIKFAAKNMGTLSKMAYYNKMTMKEFAGLFKNPLLVKAIQASIPEDYTSMALVATLAGMNAGDCGYPEGGSRALAKRMEKRYLDLGGKIFYKARVDKILVEDGKAVGIKLTDGKEARADHVVSCADGYATLKYMLEDKYTPELYENLFSKPKEYPTVTSALVFMGVNAEIPYEYRSIEIHRDKPVTIAGKESEEVMLLHYGYDKNLAPKGKTVMACYYTADYDYWKELHKDKEKYKAAKEELKADAIASLIKRYPEAEGKIETTDVVTPVTYERYCNAWRGAWMTWTNMNKDVPRYYPGVLPGLENFIMAGMWTMPPGGLPGAGAAGRFAAHRLCLQNGIEFKTT
jgi:phytoene desaturase